MRFLILIPCLLLLTSTAPADEDLTVLKAGPGGGPPASMLSKYLNEEARKAFDARRATLSSLKTPEAMERRRRDLRGKFLEALGAFPEKTPLEGRVIGPRAGDGYRLERVIYESRPDHHVTA